MSTRGHSRNNDRASLRQQANDIAQTLGIERSDVLVANDRQLLDMTARAHALQIHAFRRQRDGDSCSANDRTLASPVFRKACELAGLVRRNGHGEVVEILASRRQASKWNAGRGLAYAKRNEALRQVGGK